jgi:hypothetical protein
LPVWAALFAIVLPWSVYVCAFSIASRFIPFYPWAFGIALIHLSRILKPWPNMLIGCKARAVRCFNSPAARPH